MKDDTTLRARQTAIKEQIGQAGFQTLADIILSFVGRTISLGRSQRPTPRWFNASVLGLFVGLITVGLALILGERPSTDLVLAGTLGIGLGILLVFLTTINSQHVYRFFREQLVDSFVSVEELDEGLSETLSMFDLRRQIGVSVVIGIVTGLAGVGVWILYKGSFPGIAALVGAILAASMAGSAVYWVIPLIILPHRLSNYTLKLYAPDPRHSEVIGRLSEVLRFIVLMGGFVSAILTAGLVILDLLNPTTIILYLAAASWGPLIVLFVSNQYGISKIIINAKWQTLNEVQQQIEVLRTQDEIPSQESLERIRALMDHHDRIRSTGNSALDLIEMLRFLNSLLLPVIAFFLTNLDLVIGRK